MRPLTPATFHTVATWKLDVWTYEVDVCIEHTRWSMSDVAPKDSYGGHWRPTEFLATWGDRLEAHAAWLLPYVRDSITSGAIDPTILADATARAQGVPPRSWNWDIQLSSGRPPSSRSGDT